MAVYKSINIPTERESCCGQSAHSFGFGNLKKAPLPVKNPEYKPWQILTAQVLLAGIATNTTCGLDTAEVFEWQKHYGANKKITAAATKPLANILEVISRLYELCAALCSPIFIQIGDTENHIQDYAKFLQ